MQNLTHNEILNRVAMEQTRFLIYPWFIFYFCFVSDIAAVVLKFYTRGYKSKRSPFTFESQIGCESFPLPSLPNFTASWAFPSNNSRHTMVASWISQESSQTVPQTPS